MKLPGYYTSGQFAHMAEVSVRTIRYYDQQNILKPSYINESGARFYTDEDFVRLQQILLLKYLGFSLEDIREMTINDTDYHLMQNALNLQLKLIDDKIEQMQLVKQAIQDTSREISKNHTVNWSQMLHLIHLTGMEKSLKTQYQNASNISAVSVCMKCIPKTRRGGFHGFTTTVKSQTVCAFWKSAVGTVHSGMKIWQNFLKIFPQSYPIFQKACCVMSEGVSAVIPAFLFRHLTATGFHLSQTALTL